MKMRALAVILLMLAMVGNTWAVDCSSNDFTLLDELKFGGDFRPHDVAIGPGGLIYVTDFFNDQVTVFDRGGNIVKFRKVTNPHGIAIDDSGNLYIGWANNNDAGHFQGQVDVYDASLNLLGSLGSGYGEFQLPYSIAVDATRVFVADNRANHVKVFDKATGELISSFGGYGTADGNLVRPTGIVVHSPGVLFVADSALVSGQGGYGYGAGVHKFTIDEGNNVTFIMKFANHGYTDGSGVMASPGGIAVDREGRVLVSDSTKGNIEVFTADGASVCEFQIAEYTMFPRGMEGNAEGKLMVAAHGRVYVYGLGQYADMSVEPNKLIIDAEVCGASGGSSSFQVSNNGAGLLDWVATESVAWMQLSSTAGSLSQGGGETVVVSADASGLAAGSYRGVIGVTSAGVEEVVSVALNVAPAPTLESDVSDLSFIVIGNDVPAAQSVNVTMSGGSGWTANAPDWISMTPSAGDGGALTLAAVGVNAAALDAMDGGEYSGSITIDSGCAGVEALAIPVTLTYVKGGSIEVTTNNENASFTISGPELYSGKGKAFRVDGVAEGIYRVAFGEIAGFRTPISGTLTVTNGNTATYSAEYMDLRESNDIIVSRVDLSRNDENVIAVYSSEGVMSSSFMVDETSSVERVRSRDARLTLTAAGDVDGDGLDEIIASHDGGTLTGYEADGSAIAGLSFAAFPYSVVTDVATGDLNGDGVAEIVVGANGNSKDAAVRVFGYSGGSVSDTGVYFLASDGRDGVSVAAGDVDGDGVDELVTVTPDSKSKSATVRVWKADASGGAGNWSVVDSGGFTLPSVREVSDLAVGDVDADGNADILVASRGVFDDGYVVGMYSKDGTGIGSIAVSTSSGVYVAVGDTDLDGTAEIVVADSMQSSPSVALYRADGSLVLEFNVFMNDRVRGASVSLGQVAR